MLKPRNYYSSDEEYRNELDNEYIRFIKKLQKSLKYGLCTSNLICKLKKIRNYILGETLEYSIEGEDIQVNTDQYLVESSTYIDIVTSDGKFIKRN